MDYESLIEKNVNHMMDKMFGDKDATLKSITKMNLLYDGEDDTKTQIEDVLTKMKRMNNFEAKCIEEELYLTYDIDGNIVSLNCINNEPKNDVYEESKGEPDTDFCPSNR
jgi:hypothetical protein